MEGICVIEYDNKRFDSGGKVMEYVRLFRNRSNKHISSASEVLLANVIMSVWAIYYNKRIVDEEAFVDSLGYCVSEDIEIINAMVLMMNITEDNLLLFGLSRSEAALYCVEFPRSEYLHCKAVSRLYGLMKDSPKMRSGLKKLYKHISTTNNSTLVLNIEKFYEVA